MMIIDVIALTCCSKSLHIVAPIPNTDEGAMALVPGFDYVATHGKTITVRVVFQMAIFTRIRGSHSLPPVVWRELRVIMKRFVCAFLETMEISLPFAKNGDSSLIIQSIDSDGCSRIARRW
jgi:hypothetical protein